MYILYIQSLNVQNSVANPDQKDTRIFDILSMDQDLEEEKNLN